MREAHAWSDLLNDEARADLDVYIDLKSPHAYLAVRPTMEVARDYAVRLNFLPYTLSYEALGVSTSVESDMKRRPPSPAADRKARMYYATAREYARLQGLPLRSPVRLLDSDLAHRFLLYAKTQHLELQFAMYVYLLGWCSGWREFELESHDQLAAALTAVGADTRGLTNYLGQSAERDLKEAMDRAERAGAVGVPHYVFSDPATEQSVGLFGREHLALIRGKFAAAGYARRADVTAEFSHAWTGPRAADRTRR